MKNEKDIEVESLNEFTARFSLDRNFIDDDSEHLSTRFAVQNEEDNILYFYYHVLDIAKGIIDGSINMYQLPKHENLYFETHEYAYHTKELLKEYMKSLYKDIRSYNISK